MDINVHHPYFIVASHAIHAILTPPNTLYIHKPSINTYAYPSQPPSTTSYFRRAVPSSMPYPTTQVGALPHVAIPKIPFNLQIPRPLAQIFGIT